MDFVKLVSHLHKAKPLTSAPPFLNYYSDVWHTIFMTKKKRVWGNPYSLSYYCLISLPQRTTVYIFFSGLYPSSLVYSFATIVAILFAPANPVYNS